MFNPNPELLLMWAASFGNRVAFKAGRYQGANAGKLCHSWIEARLNKTEMPPIPPGTTQIEHDEAHQAFKSWELWLVENKKFIKSWQVELKMQNELFGGTCDAMVEMQNGAYTILDWKSNKKYPPSSAAYKSQKFSWLLQLAAYAKLIEETRNIVVNQARIVHLSKRTPQYLVVVFKRAELDEGWALFEHLLAVHQGFAGSLQRHDLKPAYTQPHIA